MDGYIYHEECMLSTGLVSIDALVRRSPLAAKKCWRCGATNRPQDVYCRSCATNLRDTRDGEPLDLGSQSTLSRLLKGLGKVIARSILMALLFTAIIASLVGVIDLLAGNRLLAGIGFILAAAGLCIAGMSGFGMLPIGGRTMASFRTSRGGSKWSIRRARYDPITFLQFWRATRSHPFRRDETRSVSLFISGAIMFLAGLFLS